METPVNEIYEKGESKYLMITLAAKRMKKLLHGEKPLVDIKPEDDVGNIALREMHNGKLKLVLRKKSGKVIDLAKQNS